MVCDMHERDEIEKKRLLSPAEFRALLASLPSVDNEFAADVRAARASLGPPEGAVWPPTPDSATSP
jgi:hypothetical protein